MSGMWMETEKMDLRDKLRADFKPFFETMLDELERHYPEKGDSWKVTSHNYFYKLFYDVLDKYEHNKNPDEFVDMANVLAMWWMTTPRMKFYNSSEQKVIKDE